MVGPQWKSFWLARGDLWSFRHSCTCLWKFILDIVQILRLTFCFWVERTLIFVSWRSRASKSIGSRKRRGPRRLRRDLSYGFSPRNSYAQSPRLNNAIRGELLRRLENLNDFPFQARQRKLSPLIDQQQQQPELLTSSR